MEVGKPFPLRMLRNKEVITRTGISKSGYHQAVCNGLMPKPVPIGARAKGTPEHEIQIVIAARIEGRSEDEIRKIIQELMQARKGLLELIGGGAK